MSRTQIGENPETLKIIMNKNFKENTQPLGEENTYLNCECNNEVLRITKFNDEDNYYLTIYSYHVGKYSLWDRFKILFGGEVKTAEIILSKENFKKLKQVI